MDEGARSGKAGALGRAALRLCSLVAQGPRIAEERVPARGEKELTREEEESELIYFRYT